MLTMKSYLLLKEEKEEDKDPPFTPDKKKTTPWTNPKSKAKQLARAAMKSYKEKNNQKKS